MRFTRYTGSHVVPLAQAPATPAWMQELAERTAALPISTRTTNEPIGRLAGEIRLHLAAKYASDPSFDATRAWVRGWTSEGMATSKFFHDSMQGVLDGKLEPGPMETVAFRAMAEAPRTERTLYRGFVANEAQTFRVGQVIDGLPASWTSRPDTAIDHSPPFEGMSGPRPKTPHAVVLHLAPGAKALPTMPFSDIPSEYEYLSGGRYEVTRVRRARRAAPEAWKGESQRGWVQHVYLKQTGVYLPASTGTEAGVARGGR